MHVLIATDIWGRTTHVDAIAKRLRCCGRSVTVVDPYLGEHTAFTTEDNAHNAFLKKCGHIQYGSLVSHVLGKQQGPVFLVGFSAGAAAVWQASGSEMARTASAAACFYGSQIRNMMELQPAITVDLVLPKSEPHFSVDDLIEGMRAHPMVTCHKTSYLHGFMNILSDNYDTIGYEQWMSWLTNRIQSTASHG